MPKTTKQFAVMDVSSLSFHGYHKDMFDTLAQAMAHVGQEIIDGNGERFEIEVPGSDQNIEIDARYVDLDEVE